MLLTIGTLILFGGAIRFFSWRLATQKKWRLTVTFDSQPELDEKICYLPSNKSIGIGGGDDSNCIAIIDCPGSEVRAYLVRRGNRLYLEPTGAAPIYWGEREITKRTRLHGTRLQLNCPDRHGLDFYLNIKVSQ